MADFALLLKRKAGEKGYRQLAKFKFENIKTEAEQASLF